MKTEYLKIYTSSLIIINSIRNLLAESARLAGFGSLMDSVELYILKKDLEKSEPILNAFKKEINS